MPIVQYPEDLASSLDLQHWVMFFIYTRTGAAPDLIPPAGGGGLRDGSIGAGRRIVPGDATVLSSNSIALHIDEKPSASYGAVYDNVSITNVALAGGAAIAGLAGSKTEGLMKEILKKAAVATAAVAAAGGARLAESLAGEKLNPFRRIYFDQMKFRNFEFRYRFLPKSPAESASVNNIIRLFKYHMHPDSATPANLLHIYPDEFEILYFYGTTENNYWHKIARCVLTDLKVDYGGENFSAFPNGVPSEIYLNMNFQETEVLDKARINSGY